MQTVPGFKEFAGWPQASTRAVGVIRATRSDPSADQNPIIIAQGSRFVAGGIAFTSSEPALIRAGESIAEVSVVATTGGVAGNVPASRQWQATDPDGGAIAGVVWLNEREFTGGREAVTAHFIPDRVFFNTITDTSIQTHISLCRDIIRDRLGYEQDEPLPVHLRIDTAVYTLTLFFIENRSSQHKVTAFNPEPFNYTRTDYFRAALEPAINKRITT